MNSVVNYVQKTFSFKNDKGETVTITGYNTAGNLWVTSSQGPEEFAANLEKYGLAPSQSGKGFVLNMSADVNAAIASGIKIATAPTRIAVKEQLNALKVVNGAYVL